MTCGSPWLSDFHLSVNIKCVAVAVQDLCVVCFVDSAFSPSSEVLLHLHHICLHDGINEEPVLLELLRSHRLWHSSGHLIVVQQVNEICVLETLVWNVHWSMRMKNEDSKKNRTCVCLDAPEFVFVHICEERSLGPVFGRVAALSYVTCFSLHTKTNTRMVA